MIAYLVDAEVVPWPGSQERGTHKCLLSVLGYCCAISESRGRRRELDADGERRDEGSTVVLLQAAPHVSGQKLATRPRVYISTKQAWFDEAKELSSGES
jgi:hypothetical protein